MKRSTPSLRRFAAAAALIAGAVATSVAAAPTAEAVTSTPIDQFVDCTDSFWAIACGFEPQVTGDEVLGITLTPIDSDPSCAITDQGMMICHS